MASVTAEKAIKKVMEHLKNAEKIGAIGTFRINPMKSGNVSFRYEYDNGKLIAQFSLASLIKKRLAKKKVKK